MIGIVAMCMSSADSNINSVSVIITHDFCNVLNLKIRSELFLSKIIAVLLGIASVFLAMLDYDLLPLVFLTQSFYIPIIDVPLIMAILGFKSSVRAVLIGMVASLISVFVWRIYFMEDTGIDSILPATVVNLVFFISSHYLLNESGGWKKKPSAGIIHSLQNTIVGYYRDFNFIKLISNYAPKNSELIVTCGVFCCISTICSMYSISNSFLNQPDKESLIIIYETMLSISVFLMAYPIWPELMRKNKLLSSMIWNSSICYVMIFCNSFLMILGGITESQITILVLNILTLAVLVNWRSALVIITSGMFFSFYLLNSDITPSELNINSTWVTFYSIMLSITVIVMFLKPKQDHLEETEAKIGTLEKEVTHLDYELADLSGKVVHYSQRASDHEQEIERLGSTAQKILNNVNHELRLPIGNVVNFSDMLQETLQKSDDKQLLQELSEEVFKNSTRVSTMILNMLDLATLEVKKVDLQKRTINFGELVENRVRHCRKIYLEGKKIDFELSIQPEVMIAVDPNYIRQMVDNIIINAISYSRDGLIKVTTYREAHSVVLIIEDQGIGIPSDEIYDIFDSFKIGSKTGSKAEGRGIGLALCKSVAKAHDGEITAESDGVKGATFTVILPL